jgi:NitT/TauT family transport system permease protein
MALAEPLAGDRVKIEALPAPPKEGRRRNVARFLPPFAVLVAVVAVWQLVSDSLTGGRKYLLPPPLQVIQQGFLARASYQALLPAFGRTTELAVVGLVVSMVLGVATGTVLFRFGWLERASYPYLVALQAVPILAIAPLMGAAFGYKFSTKLMIVVVISFFPIPTSLLLGLKSVDRGLVDLFALHRAGWTTRFVKLAMPNALPNLFTGFRISAGLSVIGAIVGEQSFQAGEPGLGMLLLQYIDYVEYDQVYACIIASSFLGISMYMLFTWLSARLFGSWHASVQHDKEATRRKGR